MDVVDVVAAHVLVIDPHERVLLLHGMGIGPAGYWVLPGGGVEPGETPLQAAIREVWHETGLRLRESDLAGPIGSGEVAFTFGDIDYRQRQHYFAAWVGAPNPETTGVGEVSPVEPGGDGRNLLSFDWWSLDQLRAHQTSEVFAPPALAQLLASQLHR